MKAYFYNKKKKRIYTADRGLWIKYNPDVTKLGLCFGYNAAEIDKRIKKRKIKLSLVNIVLAEDICPF